MRVLMLQAGRVRDLAKLIDKKTNPLRGGRIAAIAAAAMANSSSSPSNNSSSNSRNSGGKASEQATWDHTACTANAVTCIDLKYSFLLFCAQAEPTPVN